MTKSAHELSQMTSWSRLACVVCVAGALFAQSSWAQSTVVRGFQRVPSSGVFDSKFMPFQGASPLENYGAMGSAPWVTLRYPGRPGEQVFLHLASLRLQTSAPREVAPTSPSVIPRQDPAQRTYAAQDVRVIWTNRKSLVAWLTFDAETDALRKRLKESGRLPTDARVQALGQGTYAEVSTVAGSPGKVVLRKTTGQLITPEAPTPTWVEPLLHEVFIACVAADRIAKPPLSKEVFGNRYERDKRCGLMGEDGRWLTKPEFEFIEFVNSSGRYLADGPLFLMLRGDEPCIAKPNLPVKLACLGQTFSSLFVNGRLSFSSVNPESSRRGGNLIGYVSTEGTWAISPKFRETQAFSGKVASIDLAGVPGVIDGAGRWVTPPVPSDPVAAQWLVQRAMGQMSGSGLINRSGQMVIPFLYPKVESLGETSYQACHQSGCDTIQIPRAPAVSKVKPIASNVAPQVAQSAAGWIPAGENGLWGYQEANGQWALKPRFEETEPFEGGLAKAKLDGRWGVLLPSGKWLHTPDFQWISPFSNGVAVGQTASSSGEALLRADGKRIDIAEGNVLSAFGADGLAVVGLQNGEKTGYMDRNGAWLIPPAYSQAQPFSGGYAIVSGKLPEGWRPTNFTEPPYILRSVHWLSPDVLALRALIGSEERVGLMDKDGNWLVPAP